MRIVSKFHDYYDSVQGMGIDKSCVYVRKRISKPIKDVEGIGEVLSRNIPTNSSFEFYERDFGEGKRLQIFSFVVGFCGKLVYGYKFSHFEDLQWKKDQYFYSPKGAEAYFKKFRSEFRYFSGHHRFGGYNYAYRENIKDFVLHLGGDPFAYNSDDKALADFHQKINSPVFLYPETAYPEKRFNPEHSDPGFIRSYPLSLMINPCLKDLDFYRYADPYTCYQDIYQYIGGVLTNTENIETKMTDLDKVNQHGFDEKYGFRTRPGSKKKKKNK
ncbi:MAG: hypothetical protein AAF696_21965 [Bacteroidota bacterium]